MARFIQRLQEIWNTLGINQKVSLVLATGFLVIGMGGIVLWASRPQMELLFKNISEKDMGEVVRVLEENAVEYDLKGSSTVYVTAGKVHAMRIQLAEQGLPQGGEKGYELFDQPSLGFSEMMQQTNRLRSKSIANRRLSRAIANGPRVIGPRQASSRAVTRST